MEQNLSGLQNLLKLQRWLEYEISTFLLVALSWFLPVMMLIVLLAAIIFTPVMLKALNQEKKTGWIVSFIILIIIPMIISGLLNFFLSPKYLILIYFPIAGFFLYCFMLKLAIRGWINDYKFIHGILPPTESLN